MKNQILKQKPGQSTTLVITLLCILFLNTFDSIGQKRTAPGKIANKIKTLREQVIFEEYNNGFTFSGKNNDNKISGVVKHYTLLNTGNDIARILNTKPAYIRFVIPSVIGTKNMTLLLYKTDISPSGLTIKTGSGKNQSVTTPIVHYRGIIENDHFSVASVSFSENETMGLISNKDGNYVLGKIENSTSGLHIVYNDIDLIPQSNITCGTNTAVPVNHTKEINQNSIESVNCVNWYWETDYDLFLGKGSVANVSSYINGIFNQVSTLYDNDGITINLQTTFIWDTIDPYTGPNTSNYLNQFAVNRTSFTGDLATLLGYAGSGGIAWVDGICAPNQYRMSYCGISSGFNTVPVYSWTVEVVTHEQGHLLGSEHTHDCVWNGNNTKIDACGDVAGYPSAGCPNTVPATPAGGGTIMSYCHLVAGTGINFSNGFGPQPAALILGNVNGSGCLGSCINCPLPAQPGTISGNSTVCPASINVYSIASVSGATSYTWTLPLGWSGSSTTNSISVTTGLNSGSISVAANNACGTGLNKSLPVTISGLPFDPEKPTAVNGNSKVCDGDVKQYSVPVIFAATSYLWTPPSGATITAGQGTKKVTITYNSGFLSSDSLYVQGVNNCGSGNTRGIFITRNTPAKPSVISGQNSNNCNLSGIPFSVTNVNNMTYNWTFNSAGATIASGQGTNSITADFTSPFLSDNLTVTANNACGSSVARILAVKSTPATPGTILGASSVCLNQQGVPYSISPVFGAVSYTWSGPAGSRFSDGITTSTTATFTTSSPSVTVNFKTTAGQVKVKSNNACGSSSFKTKTVVINCKQGIASAENDFELSVSPNPVQDLLTISFYVAEKSAYTLRILDLTGRELKKVSSISEIGTIHEQIDVRNLSKGFYMLEALTGTNRKTQRILIQ